MNSRTLGCGRGDDAKPGKRGVAPSLMNTRGQNALKLAFNMTPPHRTRPSRATQGESLSYGEREGTHDCAGPIRQHASSHVKPRLDAIEPPSPRIHPPPHHGSPRLAGIGVRIENRPHKQGPAS